MKNAFLAILGVFAFSTAFACSGAPPVTVQTELSFKDYHLAEFPHDVVVTVADFTFEAPCVDQKVFFNVDVTVPVTRPGFVYKNVDYENHVINHVAIVDDHPAILDKKNSLEIHRFSFSEIYKQIDGDIVHRSLG